MFENETTNHSGRLYSARNTLNSPRPVRNAIPIMVGGSGEKRTLKIAAKYADISHLFANSPQELSHKLQVLRGHCLVVKRDFSKIKIAVGMRVLLDPTETNIRAQAERIAGMGRISLSEAERMVRANAGIDNVAKTVQEYQRLGVSLITLTLHLEEMKSFKDQVISKLN
jgi:alkanesulfonate monooxygenase SsuD/methylene tetrahydromethanopterin reductase-like flavin-dependent oxidoreductase (luciferase family)